MDVRIPVPPATDKRRPGMAGTGADDSIASVGSNDAGTGHSRSGIRHSGPDSLGRSPVGGSVGFARDLRGYPAPGAAAPIPQHHLRRVLTDKTIQRLERRRSEPHQDAAGDDGRSDVRACDAGLHRDAGRQGSRSVKPRRSLSQRAQAALGGRPEAGSGPREARILSAILGMP